MARKTTKQNNDSEKNSHRTTRKKPTPKPTGRVLERILDDFNKTPDPKAHVQWTKLLEPNVSLAMFAAGTDVDADIRGINYNDSAGERYVEINGRDMRNLSLASASEARKAIEAGHPIEASYIKREHPAVKRIIEQLPDDHSDEGIDAMLKEVKTLVDLEFAKWMVPEGILP